MQENIQMGISKQSTF